MVKTSEAIEPAFQNPELPAAVATPSRKPSIPFTEGEALVYAKMLSDLTMQKVGAEQDKHGQWAVVLETQVVTTKRLTTLNAVHKMMQKVQQSMLPGNEEETPQE